MAQSGWDERDVTYVTKKRMPKSGQLHSEKVYLHASRFSRSVTLTVRCACGRCACCCAVEELKPPPPSVGARACPGLGRENTILDKSKVVKKPKLSCDVM